MKEQKYEEAQNLFEDLDGYKDSNTMYYECEYQNGKLLIKSKEYEKAEKVLDEVIQEDYKDSKEQQQLCEYELAKQQLKKENYKQALEKFEILAEESFKNSEELYNQCKYNLGKVNVEAGLYEDAISYWENVDYKNAKDLYKKAKYETGKKFLNEKSYDKAIECLKGLEYEDSETLVDSIENGDTSIKKFAERYNAMADQLNKSVGVSIGKLDANNLKDNQIETSIGAVIKFNSSEEDEDCRYNIVSFIWS